MVASFCNHDSQKMTKPLHCPLISLCTPNACSSSTGCPSPQVLHVTLKSMQPLLDAVEDDDSATAVSSAIISMAAFVDAGGCADLLSNISEAATRILQGDALCQQMQSDCDEWEDSDIKEVGDPNCLYMLLIPCPINFT